MMLHSLMLNEDVDSDFLFILLSFVSWTVRFKAMPPGKRPEYASRLTCSVAFMDHLAFVLNILEV
jgi:hypothetical protein